MAAGDYSYVFGYRGSTTASADGSVVFKDAVNEAYSLAVANKFGAEFANGYELNGGQVYMESRLGIGTVTGGLGMLRVKQASETANDGIRLGTSDDLGTLRIWHDGTSAQLSEGGVTTMGLDNGKVGAGIAAPLATLHAQSTTEQIRAGYNASNYLSVTTSSTGTTTLDAVGTTPRVEIADITTFTGTSSVGIGVAPGGSGRLRLQQASETANGGIRIETSDAASTLRVWHDGTAAKISEGGIDTLTLEDGKVGVKTVVYSEQASPPVGEADKAIVFAEDNGAGKTRLMVQFGTGAAVQLAIQP